MSIAAVVGGLFMLAVFNPALRFGTPPRPEAKPIFEGLVDARHGLRDRHPAAAQWCLLALCGDWHGRDCRAGFHAWSTGTVGAPTREMQAADLSRLRDG